MRSRKMDVDSVAISVALSLAAMLISPTLALHNNKFSTGNQFIRRQFQEEQVWREGYIILKVLTEYLTKLFHGRPDHYTGTFRHSTTA